MKITKSIRGQDGGGVSKALVFVDEYHKDRLGLWYLEDECSVVDTGELEAPPEYSQNVALVETRPEIIGKFSECADRNNIYSGNFVFYVFPAEHFYLIEWIINHPATEDLSIRDITLINKLVIVRVGAPEESDADAGAFIAGARWSRDLTEVSMARPEGHGTEVKVRRLLAELIRQLDATSLGKPDAETASSSPAGATRSEQRELEKEIEDLQNRVISLQTANDILQRKYDSLANSTLGKITLKRWDKKRGK